VEPTSVVVVAGPLSAAVTRTILDRFEDVRFTVGGSDTLIECSLRDQAALRALLTQLWDVGAELLLVSHPPAASPRSPHAQVHH
jgi:hypothetical protein